MHVAGAKVVDYELNALPSLVDHGAANGQDLRVFLGTAILLAQSVRVAFELEVRRLRGKRFP